ncbi:pirin family protein [Noviherbaspirillum sp. UKPF54]|uniref:pirin family protein n=1 Tax=Noviherbaspirillum sp. UKPF54 TaxID=2601898 RepID=UPI0011B19093|nr:pirin family protein [Noviherbaspirillum sp. UKPF54]QDZ26622.1 pirin family protein [Noviherbaspirillum sp. UKPF54]
MVEVRKSEARGHANHGWFDSWHSFSFADYYDPQHMGFGALRVINEDRVAPGAGFGAHGHRNMEIISYVLDGELAHQDNMGNGSVIRPGDVQRMSAGTGVMHSEYNHAQDCSTHFLQIWIEPATFGLAPGYEEKRFDEAQKRGRLCLIASRDGQDGTVVVHQDMKLYAGLFGDGEHAELPVAPGRRAYLHVARGEIVANGVALKAGDALKLVDEPRVVLAEGREAEVLLFDLA